MYVGHVGIALALRAQRSAPPLWILVLAAQGPDWGDAVLGALHRHPDPSAGPHSLPMVAAGALVAAVIAFVAMRRQYDERAGVAAGLAAAAYLSHWIADLVTGIKPTWPGGPVFGLALYGHALRDFVVEAIVACFGWWLWRSTLGRVREERRAALAWAMLGTLLTLQLAADLVMRRAANAFL